jgi:hypothetical protein
VTFQEAFTSWLLTRPVADLVGQRIVPLRSAQGTLLPRLTWSITARTRVKALDGPVGAVGVALRLDVRAMTLAECHLIADSLRLPVAQGGIDAFGPDWLWGPYWCQALLVDDEGDGSDDEDTPAHGEEAGTALVTLTARLSYEEPQ